MSTSPKDILLAFWEDLCSENLPVTCCVCPLELRMQAGLCPLVGKTGTVMGLPFRGLKGDTVD